MSRWCCRCGYMRIFFAVDMALLKPNRCTAKNKISGSLYITVLIILAAIIIIGKQHILETNKTAIGKNGPVTIRFHRNSLSCCKTGIILKGNILCGKIIRFN